MHIVETLFLNPFEKWVHYKRFPFKFFIHLVLSIAVTSQAVIYFQRDIEHVSRTNQHLVHMFTNGDQLHSPDELQRALANLITNHFLINNRSIVRYELSSPDLLNVNVLFRDGTRQAIPVERGAWLKQKQQDSYLMEHFPFIYDLDLLPLLRELSAQQRFDEIGYVCGSEQVDDCFQCIYRWDIVTTFDGWYAGDFRTILDVTATDCQAKEWQYLHVLSISVASLAVISVFLIWRKIRRSVKVIRAFRASSQTWAQLSAQDVASMLSVWWAVALVSNLIQLVGAIECMRARPEIGQRFMWVGFSCFLTWLNMIQYFESFPSYFIAFHTIARSGIRILQLFFSVAPFFFAFILLGVCLFWKSSMFADPTCAAEMLFSLMNGDSIHEAFREIRSVGGFLLQAYLYIFIFFAIYVILNVNISIVEDAYHEAKIRYVNRQRQEDREETFSDRVRRALEEESPELDSIELLYGCSVDAAHRGSAEFGGSAQPSSPPIQGRAGSASSHQPQSPLLPVRRASSGYCAGESAHFMGTPGQSAGEMSSGLSRQMSGKYISPRLLESPGLQQALVSTFPGRRASLPARSFTDLSSKPAGSADFVDSQNSSEGSRGGLDLVVQEDVLNDTPETEMEDVAAHRLAFDQLLVEMRTLGEQLQRKQGEARLGELSGLPSRLEKLNAAILEVETARAEAL